jgi:hypothetical protein
MLSLTFFMIIFTILSAIISAEMEIHVCSASNPDFVGTYLPGRQKMDNAPVFSNANDMSFFRNNGFWYLGNLGEWPPETHYRCVEPEGCNFQQDFPPSADEGEWKGTKKFNNGDIPMIRLTPCAAESKEEL